MIETKQYKISPSTSHKGWWIFRVKAGGWFSINATEDWIYEYIDSLGGEL